MLKSNRLIAVGIGESSVKLAEFAIHGPGRIELLNHAFSLLNLDEQSGALREAVIAARIQEILAEKKISPGPTAVALAGQSVFSRLVKLPPVDAAKLEQTIEYEAVQNIPFPIDEVVWDHQVISSVDGGENEVLLVAIKSEMVESFSHAVEVAGLVPDLFDVSPIATYNAIHHSYRDFDGSALVIDFGARTTSLIFSEGQRTFMRSLPVAGNTITQQISQKLDLPFADAEKLKLRYAEAKAFGAEEPDADTPQGVVLQSVQSTLTRMCQEIKRSITFYKAQQGGKDPELILLAGGMAGLPGLDALLKERMGTEVELLNPLRKVKVGADAALPEQTICQLGELVGLALRRSFDCPVEINLMPRRLLDERAFRRRQPLYLVCAIGAVAIAGAWAVGLSVLSGMVRQETVEVSAQVSALAREEAKLAEIDATVRMLEGHAAVYAGVVGKRTDWLERLLAVQQVLPDGMFLAAVRPVYGEGQVDVIAGMRISGISYLDKEPEGDDAVKLFWEAITACPEFSDETKIVRRPSAKAFARRFVIEILFEEPITP